jgi:hypothetical protein
VALNQNPEAVVASYAECRDELGPSALYRFLEAPRRGLDRLDPQLRTRQWTVFSPSVLGFGLAVSRAESFPRAPAAGYRSRGLHE